jgi:two-component system, NtrC family, sensor kinase
MSMVFTQKERCKGCYACVRGCPSKAIKVENQRAEVMQDLCVNCGACVRVCVPKAKRIESDIETVHQLISSGSRVIAILSSSFPAAISGCCPGKFVTSLKKLGFSEVMEDAFGAEMVSSEYKRILHEQPKGLVFSSTCPAVVSYVEKFFPKLVGNLAPVVSPMVAMGRLIKQDYDPAAKVVFIGPCIAKKAESKDAHVAGVIDAVLTFPELSRMFTEARIDPAQEKEGKFSGPKPDMARLFAISDGLLRTMGFSDDLFHSDIINAHGRDYTISLLNELSKGEIEAHFINFFFCHGCINGPSIANDLSIFRRRELVAKHAETDSDPKQTALDLERYSHIDLRRTFQAQNISLPHPSEAEVQEVFARMGKSNSINRFDCRACGYRNCRELAEAVACGQAETSMCWPYLLSELKETQDGLFQAEKLSSLGQLAASIAHEINNPLSGVLVYTQLLNKKISNDNFSKETSLNYLGKMESELTRSTKLVRNLLNFARQSPPSLRLTDINDTLNRSLDLVISSIQIQHLKVEKEFAKDLPKCMIDPDQFQQVFINLIINAVQAMKGGGVLTLRTCLEEGQIRMDITDTGCGIAPENINKLFTPFFTTKKEVKGVGLGLAVSYGIIQRHHGKILVRSKEGAGTTFSIYLPVSYAENN